MSEPNICNYSLFFILQTLFNQMSQTVLLYLANRFCLLCRKKCQNKSSVAASQMWDTAAFLLFCIVTEWINIVQWQGQKKKQCNFRKHKQLRKRHHFDSNLGEMRCKCTQHEHMNELPTRKKTTNTEHGMGKLDVVTVLTQVRVTFTHSSKIVMAAHVKN